MHQALQPFSQYQPLRLNNEQSSIEVSNLKMHERGHSYMFCPLCLITAFLLLPIAFSVVREYLANRQQHSDIAPVSLGDQQVLHLDRSKLQAGQMHLFEVSASGQKLLFLVQKTQDKTVHVALASCKLVTTIEAPTMP